MDYLIRKPKPKDASAIQEVFYKTWLQTYPNEELGIKEKDIEDKLKDRFSEKSTNKFKEIISNLPDSHYFLVAELNSKIIGVCRAIKREEVNQLQAIYVLPEYQNKGIGRGFWNEVLSFFNDDKDIIVHVATYNNQAVEFYKKLGFKDAKKRFTEERHKIGNAYIPEMEMIFIKSS